MAMTFIVEPTLFIRNTFAKYEQVPNVLKLALFKGDLRPKLHPCFDGITLLILCRKELAQSFVVF